MRIDIVCPVSNSSTRGNGVTARRWAGILKKFGHSVFISNSFDNAVGSNTNLVVGIHATRSSAIMQTVAEQTPNVPLVVCLSGTDLNQDLAKSESDNDWQRSSRCLDLADRVILLEPEGYKTIQNESLRKSVESKSTVIYQSAFPFHETVPKRNDVFEVSVIGHLRPVKDPFRTALAASQLPEFSKIQVVHFGQALSDEMCEQAIAMEKANARYRWVGNRSHDETNASVGSQSSYRVVLSLGRCAQFDLRSGSELGPATHHAHSCHDRVVGKRLPRLLRCLQHRSIVEPAAKTRKRTSV